jgi:hypothetical protein
MNIVLLLFIINCLTFLKILGYERGRIDENNSRTKAAEEGDISSIE